MAGGSLWDLVEGDDNEGASASAAFALAVVIRRAADHAERGFTAHDDGDGEAAVLDYAIPFAQGKGVGVSGEADGAGFVGAFIGEDGDLAIVDLPAVARTTRLRPMPFVVTMPTVSRVSQPHRKFRILYGARKAFVGDPRNAAAEEEGKEDQICGDGAVYRIP